ncbi:MAG: NUDIX hydrolase [Planctomycetaceae bacterium]|nr:NUDIX hydrolase [Planctomycetaceae bacterium]
MVMRESLGGCALIVGERDGQRVYLANWNEKWHAWSWVGGHKRDDESFRECVVREVHEELGLDPATDYTVAERELKRLDNVAMSASAGAVTNYVLVWFAVQLAPAAIARLADNTQVRWLTEREIIDLHTADGQPVSSTMLKLIETLGPSS